MHRGADLEFYGLGCIGAHGRHGGSITHAALWELCQTAVWSWRAWGEWKGCAGRMRARHEWALASWGNQDTAV